MWQDYVFVVLDIMMTMQINYVPPVTYFVLAVLAHYTITALAVMLQTLELWLCTVNVFVLVAIINLIILLNYVQTALILVLLVQMALTALAVVISNLGLLTQLIHLSVFAWLVIMTQETNYVLNAHIIASHAQIFHLVWLVT